MTNVTRVAPAQSPHINLAINPASLGSNSLVAAIPGARIRVLSLAVVTTAANTVTFQTNATPISAAFPLAANGGLVLPFNEHGHFTTLIGDPLTVNLSAATATAIQIQYIVILTPVTGQGS